MSSFIQIGAKLRSVLSERHPELKKKFIKVSILLLMNYTPSTLVL